MNQLFISDNFILQITKMKVGLDNKFQPSKWIFLCTDIYQKCLMILNDIHTWEVRANVVRVFIIWIKLG